jgi:hypothetical protein
MNTTVSAGSAAGGGSLAVVTIIIYLLSLKGIQVPDGVAVSLGALLTTGFHYLIALKKLPAIQDQTATE